MAADYLRGQLGKGTLTSVLPAPLSDVWSAGASLAKMYKEHYRFYTGNVFPIGWSLEPLASNLAVLT